MKILILNTSERIGGAAVAANRLMKALNKTGHEARMLVRDKQTDDERVISLNITWRHCLINRFRFIWERLMIFFHNRFTKKNLFAVSIANTGNNISKHPLVKEADIIHLHWINQGFLSLKNIRQLTKLNKPIVWTMHDMWPGTGICHHAGICEGFRNKCGYCSFLRKQGEKDLSHHVWKQKRFFCKKNIHFVTVSRWLASKVKQSSLIGQSAVTVIPNVIDTAVFQPGDKLLARKDLGLPYDKKIILMGAAKLNDPIKGFGYLRDALEILTATDSKENYLLLLFGSIKNAPNFLSNLPIAALYLGTFTQTQDLVKLYQAADVTVAPSLYETFGQTISEAMACGCPAVSFDNSGQTDIIEHQVNGYLATYQSAEDLAAGIRWVLSEADYVSLSGKAVEKVRSYYSEWIVAGEYIDFYEKISNFVKNHKYNEP